MASDLRTQGARPIAPPPDVRSTGGWLGRRGEIALALIAALCLAAALYFGWRAFLYREEGDPVASAMQTFSKQNDLIVLTYRSEIVADAVIPGPLGVDLLERRQTVIVPSMVDYRIPFAEIDAADMSWDAQAKLLTVTLPPLRISRPNLDEANARAFTDGIWVSREDAAKLARKNSEIAERKAIEYAKDKAILGIARSAAREAVRQNVMMPLQTAGFDGAQVKVRFADEG